MTREVRFSIKYRVPPKIIFDALTNEKEISKFCQCESKFEKEKGGFFSLYNGAITGTVVDFVNEKNILLKWKFSNWKDAADIQFAFKEKEGNESQVSVFIKNCPERDANNQTIDFDNIKKGFKSQIFERIATFLGYPLNNDSDSEEDN